MEKVTRLKPGPKAKQKPNDVVRVETHLYHADGSVTILETHPQEKPKEKDLYDIFLESTKVEIKKVYTFFVEDQEGNLIYNRGTSRGCMVGKADKWPGSEAQYAHYMLSTENNLSDDDKVVFADVKSGKYLRR